MTDRDTAAASWERVAEAILVTPGALGEDVRRAIARGDDPPELAALLGKVRRHAYRIVDADVAGHDEDAVLEATLAAALGVALEQRAAALEAVEAEAHGAVASYALGDRQLVDAVLADFETAPIGEGLRETLRFLRTMTLDPQSLGPADAERVRAAGVSAQALRDAIEVSAGFNLITRFADTIGARPHSAQGLTPEQAIAHEGRFFDDGYA